MERQGSTHLLLESLGEDALTLELGQGLMQALSRHAHNRWGGSVMLLHIGHTCVVLTSHGQLTDECMRACLYLEALPVGLVLVQPAEITNRGGGGVSWVRRGSGSRK